MRESSTRAIDDDNYLNRPWARQRLRMSAANNGVLGWPIQKWMTVGSCLLALASSTYAIYWSGRYLAAEDQLSKIESLADDSIALRTKMAEFERSARTDREWLLAFEKNSAGIDLLSLMDNLTPALEHNAVVVKELEIRDDNARLSLLAANSEINLPQLLRALEAIPGIDDVQVRQNPDPTQATYGMRITGLRTLPRLQGIANGGDAIMRESIAEKALSQKSR